MKNHLIIATAEPSNFVPVELKKAAEKLGIKCDIVDMTRIVIEEGVAGTNTETFKLVSKISEICKDTGALYPVEAGPDTAVIPRLNEYHMDVKLSALKRLKDAGATLVNSIEGMALCNDKLMSQEILSTALIKTPYSWMSLDADEFEKVVDSMEKSEKLKYPVIVKTLHGTHGIGVVKVDSRASLVSAGQLLLKEGIEFMVQEFLEHDQSARIIMKGDQVLAANLRGQPKDKGEFRTNSHLGSETEPYTPDEDEVALAQRIVELFGVNFCAIDYVIKKGEGGKELIVLEVNGSPGLENIQKNWPDKNLAEEVVKYACGHDNADDVQPQELKIADDAPEGAQPAEVPADALGEMEPVTVHRIGDDKPMEARIDTGAKYSSLHAHDVKIEGDHVKFTVGDIRYKVKMDRTIKIKNVHGGAPSERPVIRLDVSVRDHRVNGAEFTLADRSNMKYPVLIGRNVLEKIGLPVLVYKKSDATAAEQGFNDDESYTVEEE